MKPSVYFPDLYLKDILIFQVPTVDGDTLPNIGCNKGLSSLLKQGLFSKVSHPTDFICCLYGLNLLHQGLYNYLSSKYDEWCNMSIPFLNIQPSCGMWCGIFLPYHLIHFINKYFSGNDQKKYMPNEEMLGEYTRYFVLEYLPAITNDKEGSEYLACKLAGDSDCEEVRGYLSL